MTIEQPKREPMPRHQVLAFMAGLAFAAGVGGWCYVEELARVLSVSALPGGD